MKLGPGRVYDVVNMSTKERARLEVHELYQYEGQYIVYATKPTHQVRVFRGVVTAPGRPSCFVVLPGESTANIAWLVGILNGLPLALREGGELLYIVNKGRVAGVWDGTVKNREAMLKENRRVVDLYLEWKRTGQLPAWFRLRDRRN